MNKQTIGIIAVVVVIVVVLLSGGSKLGGYGNSQSQSCTGSTVTAVTVGHQLSSTLLAASGRRAWAIIQSPSNATNTVSVSLGGTAVAGQGMAINATTTNSSFPVLQELVFGLNTDLPYAGAVTGITNYGSTTVLVTQCNY